MLTYQSKRDETDVTNELYIVIRSLCLAIAVFLRIASCPVISTKCFLCHPQKHETSLTIPTVEESLPRLEISHHNIRCKELSLLAAAQK